MYVFMLLSLWNLYRTSFARDNDLMMTLYDNDTYPLLPDESLKQHMHMLRLSEGAAGGMVSTVITILLIVILRVVRVYLQRRRRPENEVANDLMHTLSENVLEVTPAAETVNVIKSGNINEKQHLDATLQQ